MTARRGLWLVAAIAPLTAIALPRDPDPTAAQRLTAAARAFLAGLDADARAKAAQPFDAERLRWNFVPGSYTGVPLADLDLDQRRAAHRLLREALGTQGTLKTLAVVRLESILRQRAEAAGRVAPHRDPEHYALAIWGVPSDQDAWGFRFQGHHVSLNLTVVGGAAVAAVPKFLGANPHEIRHGPFRGERVLAAEEDAARRLLASLTDEQRATAVIAEEVPPDILLGPDKPLDRLGPPAGVAWAEMTGAQRRLLEELIDVYLTDLAPEIAAQQRERIRGDGYEDVHFAWVGGTERGEPHYYRVHGPGFAIEYDNVQDGANHSHTVLHDLRDPFGVDLLRAHREAAHRKR